MAETPYLCKEAARVLLVGSLLEAASEKAQKYGCSTTHRVGSVELRISEGIYSTEKGKINHYKKSDGKQSGQSRCFEAWTGC